MKKGLFNTAFRTFCDLDIISSSADLSMKAHELIEEERTVPVTIIKDTSIRCKVGDACGLTCVFCHNEGTPVIPTQRGRGRVSIYEDSNGVDFTPGAMEPDQAFVAMLYNMVNVLGITEVHWTGGEPTLNRRLAELTQIASNLGLIVKMTSNGERGGPHIEKLYAAGLRSVNFSIFGTTPIEHFFKSDLPQAIKSLRDHEYMEMIGYKNIVHERVLSNQVTR